ncbi:MAG: hypothetical protein ACM3KE_04740 [Hyphomicrobiales bacterium]
MDPVIFPTTIAPVNQPDRVKRTKSREDSGKESAFAKQLRKEQQNSSDPQQTDEEEEDAAQASTGQEDEDGSSRRIPQDDGRIQGPSKKLIDVRV